MVAAATSNLCEAANASVQGHASEEKLISSAKQVAASTAQLLVACKVKADHDSEAMRRLQVLVSLLPKTHSRALYTLLILHGQIQNVRKFSVFSDFSPIFLLCRILGETTVHQRSSDGAFGIIRQELKLSSLLVLFFVFEWCWEMQVVTGLCLALV